MPLTLPVVTPPDTHEGSPSSTGPLTAPPADELHIASLVVHSTPKRAASVAEQVSTLPSAQVHAVSDTGKLVVTLEAPGAGPMLELIGRIQRTNGVLSATVVYQCSDTLEAMNQEMPDAARPT